MGSLALLTGTTIPAVPASADPASAVHPTQTFALVRDPLDAAPVAAPTVPVSVLRLDTAVLKAANAALLAQAAVSTVSALPHPDPDPTDVTAVKR